MIFVPVAKTIKRPGVMADNHGVHALRDGDLPGIVLPHSSGRPALAQRGALGTIDEREPQASRNGSA